MYKYLAGTVLVIIMLLADSYINEKIHEEVRLDSYASSYPPLSNLPGFCLSSSSSLTL